jgi:cysteine desulfurase
MKTIYLDNAATTPVSKKVFDSMKSYFLKDYGNASEFHLPGRKAREAVEDSRLTIADFFGAKPQEIIFTSSATESINLSHKGLIEFLASDFGTAKPEIITTQIEHKAVLETCRHLEKIRAADIKYLPVNKYGQVSLEILEKAIIGKTILVSVGYVNNEIGTVQPIREIGELLKKINRTRNKKIYFHTDATQAINYLKCNVDYLSVDFLSFTGHKIGAPKGVGALYIREGVNVVRQIDGGAQERDLRAGTENVPYIVALGKAIEFIQKNTKIEKLRALLTDNVLKIPGVKLTGHPVKRAPHIASFVVDGAEGEAMILRLSDLGIIASSGSACTSGDLRPSHVLTAIGIPPEKSHGSLRFSLGSQTTREDIDYVITKLPKVINDIRLMTPKF